MSFNVELTEEETLCLHRYFERVDETEDLSFHNPAEYLAFQRIAGQISRASSKVLKTSHDKLLDVARRAVMRGFGGDIPAPMFSRRLASQITAPCSSHPPAPRQETSASADDTSEAPSAAFRAEAVALQCMAAFDTGDVDKIIDLFSMDARVVSPFLGCLTARKFLPKVMGTSSRARLTFHDVLTNREGRPQALGYFLYGGWQTDKRGDAAVERHGVFNYVLNIDPSARCIHSMIVL
jgi:hypothetical protein